MSDKTNAFIPPAALTGSMRDFRVPGGADLLRRTEGFYQWQNLRRQNGLPSGLPIGLNADLHLSEDAIKMRFA